MKEGKNTCLTITFVRHGETDMNAQVPRVLQGQTDTQMNETGIKQTMALAWMLKRENFDVLYTSDLKRATKTASEIKKHQEDLQVIEDRRFREQDLGDFSGLSWPIAKRILKREDQTLDVHIGKSGGETADMLKERVIQTYTDLVNKNLIEPHEQLLSIHRIQHEAASKPQTSPPKTSAALPGQIASVESSFNGKSGQEQQEQPKRYYKPPIMKTRRVLVITHGGWINALFKFLKSDLGFGISCEEHLGFPRCTSIYRIAIRKQYKPTPPSYHPTGPECDYDWIGEITEMNAVSHLANLERKIASSGNLLSIGPPIPSSDKTRDDGADPYNSRFGLDTKIGASLGSLNSATSNSNNNASSRRPMPPKANQMLFRKLGSGGAGGSVPNLAGKRST